MRAPCTRPLTFCSLVAILACAVDASATGRYDARNGDECRAQVNADYRECAQMDQAVREERMREVHERLTRAIESLRAGDEVGAAQNRAIADDYAVIVDYPASPYRSACLQLYAEFQRYASAPPAGAGDCGKID